MKHYICYRLLISTGLLAVITFFTFILMHCSPGDFVSQLEANPSISPSYINALKEQFGLNKPWYIQYFYWVKCICSLNFGESWIYHMPVVQLFKQRIASTLLLTTSALALGWTSAIICAIIAAIYRYSCFDYFMRFISYLFISLPEFFLALLGIYFAAHSSLFPMIGRSSIAYDFLPAHEKCIDLLQHLCLPAFVLSLNIFAHIFRITRNCFLDNINTPYLKVARAKGVSAFGLYFQHALRNTLNPLITHFGFALANLLSGALLVENVFNYPGLGQLLFEAFMAKDQYVVMGSVIISSCMLMLGNFLADLLLYYNNPRLRPKT
mgnify:CR=1 FL=1